jgi:hypothetical protein
VRAMQDEQVRSQFQAHGRKKIRIDVPPREASHEPPPGTLLERFRAWIAAVPLERRAMPRYESTLDRVWIEWWRKEQEFFASTARLSNISRSGALLFLTDPPPHAHPVWIRLGQPEPDECLRGTVVEVRSSRCQGFAVRLKFCEPCPHRFFAAAVSPLAGARHKKSPESSNHE